MIAAEEIVKTAEEAVKVATDPLQIQIAGLVARDKESEKQLKILIIRSNTLGWILGIGTPVVFILGIIGGVIICQLIP